MSWKLLLKYWLAKARSRKAQDCGHERDARASEGTFREKEFKSEINETLAL